MGTGLGLHESRRVELQQLVLVGREAEEVAFLLGPRQFGAGADRVPLAVRADLGLVPGVVGLIAHGVPPGVLVQVNVTVGLHSPPEVLARGIVVLVRGADEPVVADLQLVIHLLELGRVLIRKLSRGHTLLLSGLLHLLAVLVRAGLEPHVKAVQALESRHGVRGNRLVRVPDVRGPVRVGNRGGQVVGNLLAHALHSSDRPVLFPPRESSDSTTPPREFT